MTFTAGTKLTAAALNAAFAAKLDTGGFSTYMLTVVAAIDDTTARGLLSLPSGSLNGPLGTPALDGAGKIPLSLLPASVAGGLSYVGAWNATTNSPALTSGIGVKGNFYTVSVAGNTTIDGISNWNVGDHIAFNGTVWEKLDGITATAVGATFLAQATIAAQRVSMSIESYTAVADANATLALDKHEYVWTSITAPRTATLRAASAYNPGQTIVLSDGSGSASATNTITAIVNPSPGTDTILGSNAIKGPNAKLELITDGISKFFAIEMAPLGVAAGNAVRLDASGNLPAVGANNLTGLPGGGKNVILNGNMSVIQRANAPGYSLTTPANGSYTLDMWRVLYDGTTGTFTVSQQLWAPGSPTGRERKNYLRWDQTVASSGSTFRTLSQALPEVRTLAGQQVTLSFYAVADSARTLNASYGQNFGTGGSPSSQVAGGFGSAALTTTPTRFAMTITLPSINGKTLGNNLDDNLQITFGFAVLNAICRLDIWDVQLERGPSASPFEDETFDITLNKCKVYYQHCFNYGQAPAQGALSGVAGAKVSSPVAASASVSGATAPRVMFNPRMFKTPNTVTIYNHAAANAQARNARLGTDTTAASSGNADERGFDMGFTTPASGIIGDLYAFNWSAEIII